MPAIIEVKNLTKQFKEITAVNDLSFTVNAVAKVYYQFFDTLRSHNSYLRFINSFTLGIAKKFGERIVFKWRRRSVNMAIMFYKDEEKFKRKLALVNKKRQKINQRILSHRS